jgi:hypothetical protein
MFLTDRASVPKSKNVGNTEKPVQENLPHPHLVEATCGLGSLGRISNIEPQQQPDTAKTNLSSSHSKKGKDVMWMCCQCAYPQTVDASSSYCVYCSYPL